MGRVRAVRAKFRCMNLERVWSNKTTTVRLLPVGPKGSAYPDGCEENKQFWEYTPGGEMNLVYGNVDVERVSFKLGCAYYVDMQAVEKETIWKLRFNGQYEHQLNMEIVTGWQNDTEGLCSGSVKMEILNQAAWPAFQERGPGSYWKVMFTEAPG